MSKINEKGAIKVEEYLKIVIQEPVSTFENNQPAPISVSNATTVINKRV